MHFRLLVSLVLSGVCGASGLAAAVTATGLVVVKDGVEVSILPALGAAGGNQSTVQVALDIEARTDDAAQRLGFRSLRGVTVIDCRSGANEFLSAEAYAQPDLNGPGRARHVSGDWGHPSADSYLSAVTAHVCGAAAGPAMAVTSPPSASPAVAVAPPPVPTSNPPLPPPARSPVVTLPARIAMATTAPPPVAAKAAPGGSGALAQVAASPTEKGAQGALNALSSLIAPPLAGGVEAAVVNGAKVYRASVGGFASTADAKAFCVRAEAMTKSCWVRPAALRESASVEPKKRG